MTHYPQIDGLRAFAVIGVLISHFGLGADLHILRDSIPWGHLGVRLFFVISGFLITGILLDSREKIINGLNSKNSTFLNFYGRRVLRIFPIFYLTIIFASILDVGSMRELTIYHLLYLSNVENLIYKDFGYATSALIDPTSAHFWSLAVEEQFYILWPSLVIFLNRKNLFLILATMFILAPIWRLVFFLWYPENPSTSLFACVDSLASGATLSLLLKSKDAFTPNWLTKFLPIIVIFGFVLLLFCLLASAENVLFRPRYILFGTGESIVFAFLVWRCATCHTGLLANFLQIKLFRNIGKISYGIYVYHAFMSTLQKWLWRQFDLVEIGDSFLHSLILFSMTILVSVASWYMLELPFLRLKKYFPRS